MQQRGLSATRATNHGKDLAFRFANALNLIDISNNIGDSRSLMCHNASTTHYSVSAEARQEMGVTEGMLRLNVGLEDPDDVIEDLDGVYADMFMWHAVEETEHKAVAFDVYQAVDGDYWLRVRSMAAATFFFLLVTLRMQYSLLKHDNQLGNWRDALGFAKFMLFKPGMLTRIIPEYLDFYRPGFHPWQHDNRHLIVDRIKALEPHELKALNAA